MGHVGHWNLAGIGFLIITCIVVFGMAMLMAYLDLDPPDDPDDKQ
jgi:hypothetical protein